MQNPISFLNSKEFDGLKAEFKDICTLELTVTTGLEEVAALECKEKLNLKPQKFRGRVVVDVPINLISEIFKLRAIDNISILISADRYTFPNNREECFKSLYTLANKPDWRKGLRVYNEVRGRKDCEDLFKSEIDLPEGFVEPRPEVDLKQMKKGSPVSENLPEDIKDRLKKNKDSNGDATEVSVTENTVNSLSSKKSSDGIKFRVTCHRVGTDHTFGSSEAARQLGGGINEKFKWPVDLSHYQLEVLLNIIEEFVYVAIGLTKDPLFKRNLSHFGPTNLRATIAYSMVKLAKIIPGDVVLDPMCGGSSIPIEGSFSHPSSFHLGGDFVEMAVKRSANNMLHLVNRKKSLCTDVVRWDSTALPLRDQSVDAVVCDLPFGKRSGSKADNRVLYFKSLVELARVTKVETGRAVLLTHDKNSMVKGLMRVTSLWKNHSMKTINIGGLAGIVYLLERTKLFSDPSINKNSQIDTTKNTSRSNTKQENDSHLNSQISDLLIEGRSQAAQESGRSQPAHENGRDLEPKGTKRKAGDVDS